MNHEEGIQKEKIMELRKSNRKYQLVKPSWRKKSTSKQQQGNKEHQDSDIPQNPREEAHSRRGVKNAAAEVRS